MCRKPRSSSSFAASAGIGVAYFLMAMIALMTSRFEGGLAFIWAANALLMVALYTSPTRHWPRVLVSCGVASTIATSLMGMGPAAALPMALVNLAEALIVVIICRRFEQGRDSPGGSNHRLLVFIFALCLPANVIAGAAAALVASTLTPVSFAASWLQWYSGHVLGGLICMPILLMLFQGEVSRWFRETRPARKWEALGLLLLFALVAVHVFFWARYPLLFVLLLPLVVIAFRIGYIGAAASVVVLAIIGGAATMTGHGPFHLVASSIGERTQFFQLYLAFSFLLAMPLAAELNSRHLLNRMLLDSEARFRAIAEHCGDVVLDVGIDGIINYASPAAAEQLGCTPGTLVGRPVADLVDPTARAAILETHRLALEQPGEVRTVEFRSPVSADDLDWFEMVVRAVPDENGNPTGLVSTIRDMSRHKARQRALHKVAAVDTLTGADSRWAFLAKLEKEIERTARGGNACLLLIDIDHFKLVNDRYGHGAGDGVLAGFVDRLRPGLRAMDSIGRLGGEEFAVLLAGADVERASMVCERLRKMVCAHPMLADGGVEIPVTFSAGLVALNGRADSTQVLEAADKALYRAKHGGRNCLRLAA